MLIGSEQSLGPRGMDKMVCWHVLESYMTASDWKPDTNREGRDYNSRSRLCQRLERLERLIIQDK